MNVFIASSAREDLDQKIVKKCEELLDKISSIKDLDLVYGSYNHGIMKISHDAFKKNNKKIHGITIEVFKDEKGTEDTLIKETTFDRLKEAYKTSDIMLIIPGGIGTLSELFAFLEEMKNDNNDKKLILYNPNLFYKDLINFLYELYKQKFILTPPSEYMLISSEVDEIVNYIESLRR